MRVFMICLLTAHGAIHLMGFAKAFGLARLPQLASTINRPMGLVWLAAALLMVGSAIVSPRWSWITASAAVLCSQLAIVSAWPDTKYGTLPNVVVLFAASYAFLSAGPFSARHTYFVAAAETLARTDPEGAPPVREADLTRLPAPVQRYLRLTGSVDRPRVTSFRAHWHGRIRGAPDEPWMDFEAEQINTTAPAFTRLFWMHARMKGLPVEVLHRFTGDEATFRARVLSAITVVDAAGPEMNRSETVTILNDLCLLAPSALLDSRLQWESIDAQSVRVHFTRGPERVSAVLHFNAASELVDFVSEDRYQASPDGKSFTSLRWSTPFTQYQTIAGNRLFARGQAVWHAPTGAFAYGEFELDRLALNVGRVIE